MTTNLYYSIWFIKPVSKKDAVDNNIYVGVGAQTQTEGWEIEG